MAKTMIPVLSVLFCTLRHQTQEYIAAQHDKHPAPPEIKGKAFGISEAIGKTAQERARPALEAREAKYGWMCGRRRQKDPERPAYRICEGIGYFAK